MNTYPSSPSLTSCRAGGQNCAYSMPSVGNPPLGSSGRSATTGTGDLAAYSLSSYPAVRPVVNSDFTTSSLMSRSNNPTFAPPHGQGSRHVKTRLPPITPPDREEHFIPATYSRHRGGSVGSETSVPHLNTSARLPSPACSTEYTFKSAPSAYISASRSRGADPAMHPVTSHISSYGGSVLMPKAESNGNLYDDVSARMPSMTLEASMPSKHLPNQLPSQIRADYECSIPPHKALEGMDVGRIDKCSVHNSSAAQSGGSIDKKHKCDYCSQAFARRHDRDRHERMHTGDKPYVCVHCEKRFMRSDALSRHRLVEPRCGRY